MPQLPFRRKPISHGASSLFRYIFPHTRRRARAQLSKFRHETLRSFKHRVQSRIYRYIVYKQSQRLGRKPGILQRLRGTTRRLLGSNRLENEVRLRRQKLTQAGVPQESNKNAMSYQESGGYGTRESGTRRRKLAGYLKAANELRQTYQQQYAPNWSTRETTYEYEDDTPGGFPDAAIVRSGEEEMILFPSYARKHIKRKPEAEPGTIQEASGEGRDVRDSTGAGDAEFWKQQWDNYEDDNAVVDVDVRGWIYSPHKGQMSRKQRLFIGLARQLVGIQAPTPGAGRPTSSSASPNSSRDASPGQMGHRERAQIREAQRDEILTAKEAEEILRRGEKEAEMAAKGAYSEKPSSGDDNTKLYRTQSRDSVRSTDSRSLHPHSHSHSHGSSPSPSRDEDIHVTPLQKRASWNQPSDMSSAEMAEANARLMARLRHFLAIPMANTPISVFFYNENISKQRTIYTNPSGHFSICAALDFIPTHVRILASDRLSATEEIIVTEENGVSVISDIDDTIKHSAISSGAREIFRNAFIRELGDLTIDGVKEWYNRMAELGVKFHYVSNSPWQLYPVISKYFSMAGLPPGSFHLKQYSGMLQGIFEPVAERKKSTLDKIARDFPERKFILVGDSGEADLEVYTDFVLENPGRVIAVFIRDVTTTEGTGFFDPSIGSIPGDRTPSTHGDSSSHKFSANASPNDNEDPELKAAIKASLQDLENDNNRRSKSLFPQINADHPHLRPQLPSRTPSQPIVESANNLIDLSSSDDDGPITLPPLRRVNTDTQAELINQRSPSIASSTGKPAPPPPKKPTALRSSSTDTSSPSSPASSKTSLPPKPHRPSSTVHQASPLSHSGTSQHSKPQPPPKPSFPPNQNHPQGQGQSQSQSQQTYAGMAREKLSSVYNNLPSASSYLSSSQPTNPTPTSTNKSNPPPPPPPRRGVSAYPVAAASYVTTKAASAWQNAPSRPHLGTSQTTAPFSTTSNVQNTYPARSNTYTNAGGNDNGNGNGNGNGNQPPNPYEGMNKREILWHQRWAKAEQIMADHGVVLRTWRIGSDVVGEAERLVKEAGKRRERKEGGRK